MKFNPDEDKQDVFVAGTADKKIICVSDSNRAYPLIYGVVVLLLHQYIGESVYPMNRVQTGVTW